MDTSSKPSGLGKESGKIEKNAEFPVGCKRVARDGSAWKFWVHQMSEPVKEIEVEVLEIDGVRQESRVDDCASGRGVWGEQHKAPPWAGWQGKVRGLDRRWWPLWVLLGLVLAFFAVVVGVIAMVVMLVIRLVVGFVKALSGASGGAVRLPR